MKRGRVEQHRAWRAVQRAVEQGVLVRPDHCERCGVACKPDASHDDYAQPLAVEWLCRLCHHHKDRPHVETCQNGHERTPENVNGSRACRECNRVYQREWRRAKKAKEESVRV